MSKTEKVSNQHLGNLLSSNQLKEDYFLLRSVLEEGHAGLYAHRNKTEIDTKFEDIFNKLDTSSTLMKFYEIIADFIDFIADGHTSVTVDSKIRDYVKNEIGIFPIKPVFVDRRFYVYKNFSRDESISVGTEILKINDISINEIIEKLLSFVYIDGFGIERKFRSLEKNFSCLFPLIFGVKNNFEIEYRVKETKEIRKTKLDAITINETKAIHEKRFLEDFNAPLNSFTVHSDLKTAILKIGTFNSGKTMAKITGIKKYAEEDKFPSFLKSAFRGFKEEKIEKLILDLRGNGGGRDDYGALLYSYLTENEFQYYDTLYLKKKKFDFFKTTNNKSLNFILKLIKKEETDYGYRIYNPFFMPPLYKTHKKQKDAFEGDVFVLIDGGSFSAACEFCTICHRFQRVKFVGEETRGTYIGNTSGLMASVHLPHSKLIIRIPLFRYVMPVSQENNHRGIKPDYEISPSIDDISKGIDTALEYVLKNLV